MSTRYTNIGVADGLIAGTTVADTKKQYSNTGSAIYTSVEIQNILSLSNLGIYGDVTDLWIRLDYHRYNAYSPSLRIEVFFDGNNAGNYLGIRNDVLRYGEKGANQSVIPSDIYNKTVNKIVLNITTTSIILYINDAVVIEKNSVNNGIKITGIAILTQTQGAISSTLSQNDMVSNVIIADYDCSQETLVSATFDLLRKTSNIESVKFDLLRVFTDRQIVAEPFDLLRKVMKSAADRFDLKRTVLASTIHCTLDYDTKRSVYRTVSELYDLERIILADSGFDLRRTVYVKKNIGFDLKRSVYRTVSEHYDTKRTIPYSLDHLRIQSVTGVYNKLCK